MVIDVKLLLLIAVVSILILFPFLRLSNTKSEKLVYLFITLGLFIYSGFGISYYDVDNKYAIRYFIFLLCFLTAFKLTLGSKKIKRYVLFSGEDVDFTIERSPFVIKLFATVFILTLFVALLTPKFRLNEFFAPPVYNAVGIHARMADKNVINRIADTVNMASRPFFLIYLQILANNKKKIRFYLLTLLWIYLEYLQLGYLSRYQMMIYLLFIVLSTEIINYGEIIFTKKTKIITIVVGVISIPLLVAFMSIRTGGSIQISGLLASFKTLIDGETYYPIYYDRISNTAWNISPTTFLLWIICLPIPSFLWSNKPFVDPSYALTTNLYGMIEKTDVNYYNTLPSMLGEAMMIFGNYFYFVEAIIIGFFIAIIYKALFKSQKFNVLSLYLTLMLLTLGRGGATSYMSGLINGTIVLLIWIFAATHTPRGKAVNIVR